MATSKSGAKSNRKPKAQPSLPDIQAKMRLLGFVQSKDTFLELITGMQTVDQALNASYEELKTCQAGSVAEEDCLYHIRKLEDQRFQLLSDLHGNRVNDYHLQARL